MITGASRGLGAWCAAGYAREGARVAVLARTEQVRDPRLPGTIHDTVAQITAAGGEAVAFACNVGDADAVQRAMQAVLERFGRIDVLMNNAAVQPPGGVATIEPRHLELAFRVNVLGLHHCMRAVLPAMRRQRSGNILNISSVAAAAGSGSPYGATKRAVESLTIGLAREVAGDGIAVNALLPVGAIDTPGRLFARAARGAAGTPDPALPGPESYVEAAVLMALRAPPDGTGLVLDDAAVIARMADDATRARFAAANPATWVRAMERPRAT